LATLAARLLAALLALLAALTGLLARLLLPAALLLGGFSARPEPMLGGRRPFRMEQGPLCGEFATRT
jgi:hypothetical protein